MGRSIGPMEIVLLGWLVLPVLFLWFVKDLEIAFTRCAPTSRKLSPGWVWLLLIPVLNYVWQFVVVLTLAKSLEAEFIRRSWQTLDLDVFKVVSYTMAVSILVLPFWGGASFLAAVLLWPIYWWQVRGVSQRLKRKVGVTLP